MHQARNLVCRHGARCGGPLSCRKREGWQGMDCLCQVTFVGDLPFLPPVCVCCPKFVLAPRCKPP
ncbi:hypothetical protein LHK_02572 [Laribacter hongkongensis HLHK9]|uniref:Uncharacterized protein n=1 Tax=Laribacter hongkongensis (strain HLHK9) TaxID=557598 RepID=C1DBZ9_LARHH|nr:hypothetical protein LHK_02572 [Laribacter hongkongensis HLHK9]